MADLELVIIGAGGHGSELLSYVKDLAATGYDAQVCGFIDEHKPPGPWGSAEILGDLTDLRQLARAHGGQAIQYITAVGHNAARVGLVQKVRGLSLPNLVPWTLRHPRCIVGGNGQIGAGTCLAPGAIITVGVKVGEHCIINVNASLSHDCEIGDFVNVNPGAVICGNVSIGEGCFIGAGATIIDKVSIGEWTIVGAGAVVVTDLPAHVTAVGVPARVIKRHGVGNV